MGAVSGKDIIESALANLSPKELAKLAEKIQGLLPIESKCEVKSATGT